jgi:hypothetical protein
MLLPAPIAAKVRKAIAELDESFDWGRLGKRSSAIPLLLTIGTMILRSDGLFLVYEGDPLPERLIRESAEIDTVAIAYGSERYPWLSALFPPRPPTAVDCKTCGGKRRLGNLSDRNGYVYCPSCAALGWVSAGKHG